MKKALIYLRVSTARQATRGGEAEGYSIPAQRSVCQRKAGELDAVVVEEFVDAGVSARSADRTGLQNMLAYLASGEPVDYVIVHKVDRLARDRADDVAIMMAIHNANAILVSATEAIDDSPSGMLLHGIMASIAEFYSKNLGAEAKKGLHEKARRGGTPSQAPVGYLNHTDRVDGREVRTVIVDPDRGHHIEWMFEAYATGEWSISALVEALDQRGLRTRKTAKQGGTALSRSQVHRLLSNPYFIGKVRYGGVIYEGQHKPLIDAQTWEQVQDMLAQKKQSGDRSWRHSHYLKGSVFCARCGSRLGVSHSKGRSETYSYFYCLGRNKKRTNCDMPYVDIDKVERGVAKHWQTIQFAPELLDSIRTAVIKELDILQARDKAMLAEQKKRLKDTDRKLNRLIDAYLAEALPVEELKKKQQSLMADKQDAERLIASSSASQTVITGRIDTALKLMEHAGQLYTQAPEQIRRELNQVFYETLPINTDGDVAGSQLHEPFATLGNTTTKQTRQDDQVEQAQQKANVIGLQNQTKDKDGDSSDTSENDKTDDHDEQGNKNDRTKDGVIDTDNSQTIDLADQAIKPTNPENKSRGSNVFYVAEEVGFEPTEGCPSHAFQACRFGRSRTPPELTNMKFGYELYPERRQSRLHLLGYAKS